MTQHKIIDLTPDQRKCLEAMTEPKMTVRQISDKVCIGVSSVRSHVIALMGNGYVLCEWAGHSKVWTRVRAVDAEPVKSSEIRTQKEQVAFELKSRMEWLLRLAAVSDSIAAAARIAGVTRSAMAKMFSRHGVSMKRYSKVAEKQRAHIAAAEARAANEAALKDQMAEETRKRIKAGMKPEAARNEAFRMLRMNITQEAMQ